MERLIPRDAVALRIDESSRMHVESQGESVARGVDEISWAEDRRVDLSLGD